MKCPKCGSELRKGLSFCPKCGDIVPTSTLPDSSRKPDSSKAERKNFIWQIVLAVLAIVLLPITLTFGIVKSKSLKSFVKVLLIIMIWGLVARIVSPETTTSNLNEAVSLTEGNDSSNVQEEINEDNADFWSERAIQEATTTSMPTIEAEERSEDTNDASTVIDETEEKSNNIEEDRLSNLNLFIERYNSIAGVPITDTFEIDISKGSIYYRTEFRLYAFKNAPALHGTIGTESVTLVNYGSVQKDELRIYITVDSLELVTDVFESYCKASDSDIKEEDFSNYYEHNKLDSGYCSINIKNISGYINERKGEFEILIKSKPDYFK